jgi:hypothetical protein
MAAITKLDQAPPFTLAQYLYIYNQANHDCYTDYMEGANSLLAYLTENGTRPLDWQVEKYPDIDNIYFKVPRLLNGGYEGIELNKILTVGNYLDGWQRTERAIFIITLELQQRQTNGRLL